MQLRLDAFVDKLKTAERQLDKPTYGGFERL